MEKKYGNYNLQSLRSKIGYVMQDVTILENTIMDNIRYANENIRNEEIEAIFKKLNLHEKIMSLPNGYETDIYNNSDILSKGEKQLINFARIMAINPEVIILDEVTSSLSYNSEMLLKNAMKQITKGKIAIIIAHRLSTIQECDPIIVLENGKIIEQGTNEELLAKKGEYYKIASKNNNTIVAKDYIKWYNSSYISHFWKNSLVYQIWLK